MLIRVAIVCFYLAAVFNTLPLHAQNAPQLIMEQQQAVAISFAIQGNPDSWRVYKANSLRPIPGRKEVNKGTLVFRPVITFQPGITYVIKRDGKTAYTFSPPEAEQARPEAVHIYPTAETLPANLLKLYIQFSEPMAEGNPYRSIYLVDATTGDTLKDAFLEQIPALWNRDRTVLSLWLDPGRIKRDLNLNRKLGTPLEEFQNYRLVIDTTLKSSSGRALQARIEKKFSTASADRAKPKTKSWNIDLPDVGTTRPFIVHFNEPMDYRSTEGRLKILVDDTPVKGEGTFRNEEKQWEFIPAQAWKPGSYTLRADARIEDLAGNNLNRLFDRDINTQIRAEKEFYTIEFKIR